MPTPLQQFLTSEEYLGQEGEDRAYFLKKFRGLNPDQQIEVAGATTPRKLDIPMRPEPGPSGSMGPDESREVMPESALGPDRPADNSGYKDLAAMGIDAVGQGIGGTLGSLTGPAAPVTRPIGIAAGGYLSNQLNKAWGLREGDPFGKPTFDDVVNVGIPTVIGAVEGVAGLSSRPARDAVKKAKTETDVLRKNVVESNAKKVLDYQEGLDKKRAEYNAKVIETQRRDDITNVERAKIHKDDLDAYKADLKAHADSARNLPNVAKNLPVEDYEKLYAQVPTTLEVPLVKSREAAKFVTDTIDTKFPGFKDSGLYQKAQGILNWGKKAAQAPSSIVDPTTGLPFAGVPASQVEPGFKEAQGLLSDVGFLKGQAENRDDRMKGLISQLYKGVREDIMGTQGGPALDKANKAFSRSETVKDLAEIIDDGITTRRTDQATQVNAKQIFERVKDFLANDKFASKNLDPQELQGIRDTVDKLTTLPRLRSKAPDAPLTKTTELRQEHFPGAGPNPPDLKATPADVEPEMGKFPWGTMISGRMVTGGVAGTFVSPQAAAIAALAGGATIAVPDLFSRFLLSGPTGRALLEKFIAGHPVIDTRSVAKLTAIGRASGVIPKAKKKRE